MPRADPTRSDYCASRHLLRNLDDAAELRRNPLVRDYFPPAEPAQRRHDAPGDRAALERIRDDVRTALARCSEHARDRTHVALGRMHAVLLRCEIDDRPPSDVAAEIGLSERQLRRERRAAHDAFVLAFRAVDRAVPASATVCDVATVRLAEAVELQELGHGALARSAFAAIAGGAPHPGLRIEALCFAAEAQVEALHHAGADANLDGARSIFARHARDFDDESVRAADESIDLIAWLLRWQTVVSAGLGAHPPLVLAAHDERARSEPRRALFVRAAAAYAMQRWEVGDYARGCNAVQRALDIAPTLHPARTKERLALAMADAQLYSLRTSLDLVRDRFGAVEKLAAAHGHVRPMLAARSERVFREAAALPGSSVRLFDRMLHPFGAAERRSMAWTFAWVAQLVTQCESNAADFATSAQLAESRVPRRAMIALGTRCVRANVAIDAHQYGEARPLAESVYADAEFIGNGRLRGAAARSLAAIAFAGRRKREAEQYLREALDLTERFGSYEALARARALARRLNVA